MPEPTEARDTPVAVRRYTLAVLAVVYMFNFVDRQILAILLPAIRDEFRVGDTVLGLLAGPAFAIFYVTLGLPVAHLADRVNRRNLIAAAVAVWSAMTALSGLAANVWQLALARIGVGVGEAGCNPSAYSIIADLYPPEHRSSAMGLYTLGISAGIMLAYLGGGWMAQTIGWREAFFVVGIPGLALAAIVRLTLVEPGRGRSEARADSGRQPTFGQVLQFLAGRPSFAWISLGAGLCSFVGYSVIIFLPSFVDRSFELQLASVGLWLGLIYGVAGGAGFVAGGWLADRIGRGGHRRALRFIGFVVAATAALYAGVFLARSAVLCLALYAIPAATANFYLAPVLGHTQSLVSLRMRAVASAVLLLVVNVLGLGVGPLVTGIVSDRLAPYAGVEAMRYSLLIVSVAVLPVAAWCFLRAGDSIESDLARAREQD